MRVDLNGSFEFSLPSKPARNVRKDADNAARYVGGGNHNGDCAHHEHHCILYRGHSLSPPTLRFRPRRLCFAALDCSVDLHSTSLPYIVLRAPPAPGPAASP